MFLFYLMIIIQKCVNIDLVSLAYNDLGTDMIIKKVIVTLHYGDCLILSVKKTEMEKCLDCQNRCSNHGTHNQSFTI